MDVVLTDVALIELTRIADYIGQHNPRNAANFLSDILEKCDGLATFATAYPLVPRYESHGVRRRPHGDYLIFYRIKGDHVEIIHILHGARDYDWLLFPSGE